MGETNMKSKTTILITYAQVISKELLDALKESAQIRGVTLDVEIALRLMANLNHPELAENNALLTQILQKQFIQDDAVAECKRKRESTHYLYEIEKLRLFLHFEKMLPRDFKETFILIDEKEIREHIKIESENENNNED